MNEIVFPDPGPGYVIREYLGGGVWKQAFRATCVDRTADVALLYPHKSTNSTDLLKDVQNLIRASEEHRYSSYVAKFYEFKRGRDDKFFIVEELLDKPLDKYVPCNDLVLFTKIARDLCRGLTCLHESGLVHRDLKLDNCGVDQIGRAKIFDLGTMTSESREVRGTILTRAPELFASRAISTSQSDVWALGASLFALRTGVYPFAYRNEAQARQVANDDLRTGRMSQLDANKRKKKIDEAIRRRIKSSEALQNLDRCINEYFRGAARELITQMLDFNPSKRPSAAAAELGWAELSNQLGGAHNAVIEKGTKWKQISQQLLAIERNEFELTPKQLERLISELENLEKDRAGMDQAQKSDLDEMFERRRALKQRRLAFAERS